MGKYASPRDSNLDTIITNMQNDIERLNRTTRAIATSIDEGDLIIQGGGSLKLLDGGDIDVAGGGSITVGSGGQIIVDGAVYRPLDVHQNSKTGSVATMPAQGVFYSAASQAVTVPTWANTAICITQAIFNGSCIQSGGSNPFSQGLSIMNIRVGVNTYYSSAPTLFTYLSTLGGPVYVCGQSVTPSYTVTLTGLTGGSTITPFVSVSRDAGTDGTGVVALTYVILWTRL